MQTAGKTYSRVCSLGSAPPHAGEQIRAFPNGLKLSAVTRFALSRMGSAAGAGDSAAACDAVDTAGRLRL